jgi:TolB-like protein
MASSVVQDLFKRRVPQILGVYLAAGWGILEFVDWLVGRYGFSPNLTDLSLTAWACMIPTVFLVAYFHGEAGSQGWTRVEKIGIPINLLAAVAVLAVVISRGGFASGDGPIRASAVEGSLEPTRIAVLYFDDESEGQDLGHLASAFTGALIDELTQVEALDVVPRGAVKPYRGAAVSLDSIARALQIGTLVEGSVSGSKESVDVNVTLIDPTRQSSIGSFTQSGALEEWADLRDELAIEIARILRQRLGDEIRLRGRRAVTQNSDALALLGEAERVRDEADELAMAGDSAAFFRELDRADSLLARAESLDGNWAEPIVERGWIARQRADASSVAFGNFVEADMLRALWHAERALESAPGDAAALELRGVLRYNLSLVPRLTEPAQLRRAAEADLRSAVAADPFRARAWATLSALHRTGTRFAEAKLDAERALEADPFLDRANTIIFRLYETSLELREMDEAVRWCEEGHRRFPEDNKFVVCSIFLLALPGGPEPDVNRARALLDTALRLTAPQEKDQYRLLGYGWMSAVLARAADEDGARSLVERARREAADTGLEPWIDYLSANTLLLLGDRDEALQLLSSFLSAIPQRKEYVASDWMFEDLWDDPRFKALVAQGE